jgi:glucose/arabinose dehydrogenase
MIGAMRAIRLLCLGGFLLAALVAPTTASGQGAQLAQFGSGNFNAPRFVAGDPTDPGRVFVVEGAGRIRLVENGVTAATPFLDINADVCFSSPEPCGGESGLFSVAFAPDYATSGLFYVFYTRDAAVSTRQHYLRLEEFRRSAANPDVADLSSRRIVLEIPHLAASNHNGGGLHFGPDGHLYISVGDGGNGQSANGQRLTTQLGKILRIDPADPPGAPRYSVPAGNPFADGPGGNADEIYSHGLRNPWRFSFDRSTGDLAIGDVGHGNWEEVSFVRSGRGRNFGWHCFEGSAPFNLAGACIPPPANHTPPVLEYANPPGGPAAVVGGYVVRDPALPELFGTYLYADTYGALGGVIRCGFLRPGSARRPNTNTGLAAGSVVSFGEDAAAHLYVVSAAGPVYRIDPAPGVSACPQ